MLLLILQLSATTPDAIVARAAIDLGMGGPKLQVAEVDPMTGKIVKTLHAERFFVNFYDHLSRSSDNQLSAEMMTQGLSAFKQAVDKANSFGVEGIVAIATESIRAAANGDSFAYHIENETGIKLHIIDQELEGRLTFQAVLSKMEVAAEDLIVWDIGGGSMQFTGIAHGGAHIIGCSKDAAGPFKDYIIEYIQDRNVQEFTTPNPMTAEDIIQANEHACSLSKNIDRVFKDKISHPSTMVVVAGSVFGNGIAGMLGGKNSFSLGDLAAVVKALAGKSDIDLGGGDYACVEGSNTILVLGFMQGLNIQQMHITNVNNADGAIVFQPFWE